MKLNLSILKWKGFCTWEIMNALLFILLYSDCPYLTALFAFCSYANPASIFFFLFLCLYCFVHSGWSRPPVFLNRGSCQCRCSNEYVQHVLQAKQRLPKNRNDGSSAFQNTPDRLRKHHPHWNVQGTGSHPPFLRIPVPPTQSISSFAGRS